LLLAACGPSKSAISSTSTEVAASSTTAAADVASTIASSTTGVTDSSTASSAVSALTTLPGFDEFASTVKVFASGDYWQVESNGLPAHNMMVGITSWQQQVPLPMTYKGSNAWQLPRKPALAEIN
jgi:hypothetical protein